MSVSLAVGLDQLYQEITNQLFHSGRITMVENTELGKHWYSQKQTIINQLLQMYGQQVDKNQASGLVQQFIQNAVTQIRSTMMPQNNMFTAAPVYGNTMNMMPVNMGAPMQPMGGYSPLPGRHGTPATGYAPTVNFAQPDPGPKNTTTPTYVTEEIEIEGFTYKNINTSTTTDVDFSSYTSISEVVECKKVVDYHVKGVMDFRYLQLKSLLPEINDVEAVKYFDFVKSGMPKLVVDLYYPKYHVFNVQSSIFRDLKPELLTVVKESNFIDKCIKLVKSQSYTFVQEIEKVLIPEINELLALNIVTEDCRTAPEIEELDDILELFKMKNADVISLIKHDKYLYRISKIVKYVLYKYFVASTVVNSRDDINTIIGCPSFHMREPGLHKFLNFEKLPEEKKVRYLELIDAQTVLLVPNNVVYTNILTKGTLTRFASGKQNEIFHVSSPKNELDTMLVCLMSPESTDLPVYDKEFFSLLAYSWSSEKTIKIRVGESLESNMTMSIN